ncbi:PREDICTED: sulfide:quinone oxidoreductase, mitochondrial [Nicrophorus vespilloides]|uniref:Sulfide:quinone oxidoreductase, mitochondrial n=1 Tax=Nicrophorus vespilloides TaxID=110193 RepID=A0ABM1M4J0_NICVS|nr:PREDICTED: sulfide:quinone oxidoreductase, mitochondrial [Nicrophorus vespilloides]
MFSKVVLSRNLARYSNPRHLSTSNVVLAKHSCKLLVVGGGSGGCAVAAKFAKNMKKDEIIVVDPADMHYYQPMFTMIGGGIKKLKDAGRKMGDVLPKNAKWLKDSVTEFNPKNNQIQTKSGDIINYDYMLVGVGLQLNYDKIPGVLEGLSMKNSGVCSNYSPKYVDRTYEALQQFESGNAIFTFPNSPVKCPGAPQKVMYISEHYFRKMGKRDKANVIYNTSLPVLFGVKKYADALWKIVKERNINVNLRTNLIEVRPSEKVAVFENLDKPEQKTTMEYSMLHVTPPMSTPDVLRTCKDLVNDAGYVDVDKDTLRSTKFGNVFAIGDCGNSPNSKTAASVAAQSQIVFKNMQAVMNGQDPKSVYDGYASCPLVTGYGSCILAEFDYNLTPTETFPISQDREMFIMYMMKKDFMPPLYWHMMLNGYWNGPGLMRSVMHLGMK